MHPKYHYSPLKLLFQILKIYLRNFKGCSKRLFQIFKEKNKTPSILKLERGDNSLLKNLYSNQIVLETKNALFISVNGNIFPVFFENGPIALKMPNSIESKRIEIKVIGLYKSKSRSVDIKSLGALKTPVLYQKKNIKSPKVKDLIFKKKSLSANISGIENPTILINKASIKSIPFSVALSLDELNTNLTQQQINYE